MPPAHLAARLAILFTLAGVAIGVGVMLLANLMKKRADKVSGAQPAA